MIKDKSEQGLETLAAEWKAQTNPLSYVWRQPQKDIFAQFRRYFLVLSCN